MVIRDIIKNSAKDFLYYSGIMKALFSFMKHYKGFGLLILTYHSITSPDRRDDFLGLPADIFEGHLEIIKKNFKVVSMKEGLRLLQNNRRRGLYAAINFDDGYMDNYLNAYPVLKRHHIPATIFLITDYIGRNYTFWWDIVFDIIYSSRSKELIIDLDGTHFYFRLEGLQKIREAANTINIFLRGKKEGDIISLIDGLQRQVFGFKKYTAHPRQMLGWNEIKKMAGDLIEFGSHTRTHRNLCLMSDEEVLQEISGSKKDIEEKTGLEIMGFSYPFGLFDRRIESLVRKAGFGYARSTLRGINCKGADIFNLACVGGGSILKKTFLMGRVFSSFFV